MPTIVRVTWDVAEPGAVAVTVEGYPNHRPVIDVTNIKTDGEFRAELERRLSELDEIEANPPAPPPPQPVPFQHLEGTEVRAVAGEPRTP